MMKLRIAAVQLIAVLLVVVMSGCGFLKRPPNQFFSLVTIPREGAVVAAGPVPIGIDAIELPPGLDRRGIVVRGKDHKVEVRGTHQWTAPLEEMVLHTLAFNLANRLPEGMVILPGQPKPMSAVRSVSVVLEELAPTQDRMFVLDGRWTVGAVGGKGVTHHEKISIEATSMESPDIAAAMSRALATLADRMAAQLATQPGS